MVSAVSVLVMVSAVSVLVSCSFVQELRPGNFDSNVDHFALKLQE